jgi:hypothetical protein
MKKLLLLLSWLSILAAPPAFAQDPIWEPRDLRRDALPDPPIPTPSSETTHSTLTQTPEMWFYSQERSRYEDPKNAVRRNAEFRAAQRQNRLASLRWFGMSNSRPIASPTPWFGTYSPAWTANSVDPYSWRTSGPHYVVLRPETAAR